MNDSVTFAVVASSGTTMSYQWRKNGTNISGATRRTYTIAKVTQSAAADYSVRVVNSGGSVISSNATLTVLVPPSITTQPQNQTATVGQTATFSVVASGTAPLRYQWQFSGTNVAGATDATLVVTNVQFVQAGNYSVTVSNSWGTATSAQAFLTVIPLPGSDRPVAQDLVAHLTFDAGLADGSGRGNHATAVGAPNIVPGFIGAGGFNPFTQDGTNNYATFGTPMDLSFGNYTDFTIAFWTRLPVGGWNGDSAHSDPAFISNKDWSDGRNDGWVVATADDGRLQWNYNESGTQTRKDYDGPAGVFGNPIWHHVTVTFQRGGKAITYFDGVPVSTNSIGSGGESIDSGLPTNIGNDGTGDYPVSYGYWTNAFANPTNGLNMDDVGIWRRVLPGREICAIYNAGLAGQNLATVTSNNLTLVARPRITQEPANCRVIAGSSASFALTASGSAPLAYRWYGNGIPIAGATGTSLTLSNVQPAQAGNYWVVITNSAGSATSAVATLDLIAVPSGTYVEAVMTNRPLAFWRLGELSGTTAFDYVGGNDAIYTGATLNQPGALATDSDKSAGFNGTSSYAGSSVSLANNRAAFTMEGWIKLNAGSTRMGFWGQNDAIEFGLINATTFQIWTPGGGSLNVTNTWGTNSWHHLAAVGDGTNLRLYVDGNLAGTGGLATTNYGSSIYPFNLGGGGIFDSTTNWFNGCIDEVVFYDRALAATDLRRHYLLGLALPAITLTAPTNNARFTSPATVNLAATIATNGHTIAKVQFFNGATLLNEDLAAPYAYTWSGVGAGTYNVSAVVIFDLGSLASSVATVTVSTPPSITTQPLSQTVTQGQSAAFSVVATGTAPLSYQWNFNGAALSGATSSALMLNHVQTTDAGNYAVVVTNSAGSVTSAVATLTVNDAPVLSGANNPAAINEDEMNNPGTPVSNLITGQVTEADPGALQGIAVTAVANNNGTWQYSTDSAVSWLDFGTPSSIAARLLAANATTRVRFVPATNWNGTVTDGLTFRAWDQTTGTPGDTADVTVNGGTTAFSTATASSSITVAPVNDAPVADAQGISTIKDAAKLITLTGSDVDNDPLTFSIVSGPTNGVLSGLNTTNGAVTYAPTTNFLGRDGFTFRVNDGTTDSFVAAVTITVTPVGGSTACSLSFADGAGTSVSAYQVGGNIYANFTDPDANTSADSIQTRSVTVSNLSRGDVETITLTETGTSTGVFHNTGPLPSSGTAGLAQQDGSLNVAAGDVLVVSHADPLFGDQCSANATMQAPPVRNMALYLSDPAQSLDRVDPVATGDNTTSSSAVFSLGNAWLYRKQLTFNNSARPENLTNFPVLVHLTSTNFDFTKAQTNGLDIRFFDSDGATPLSHEIESWNRAVQEAFVWVKVPRIDASSSADSIWMQYGNASAADAQHRTNVWTENYHVVWHMNETNGTMVADATGNGWNGMPTSVTLAATGKADGADTYTGSSYTTLPSGYIVPDGSTTWTFESWVYLDPAVADYDRIFSQYNSGGTSLKLYYRSGKLNVVPNISGSSSANPTAAAAVSTSQWLHFVWTRSGSTDTLYVNGAATSTTTSGSGVGFAGNYIGTRDGSLNRFNGSLDEMRISSVVRSTHWISAQYAAMTDSLLTFGGEQLLGGGGATNATFTQTPTFCSSFTMPAGGAIAITNFITITNGSMPANPAITATLKYGDNPIITLANPAYSLDNSNLVWTGTLTNAVTIPSGQTVELVVSNSQPNVSFSIDYDSATKPSKITLPATTIIAVSTLGLYDAPYPGGNFVTAPVAETTAYVRATVSDPFGAYDITSLGLVIDGPGVAGDLSTTLNSSSVVASDSCSKTFEFPWVTTSAVGGHTITAIANEGTEGVTALEMVSITVTPGNDAPVANNDTYTTPEDVPLTIPAAGILTNDVDVDGDVLTALLVSNVTHGSLSLSTNGGFTYTPNTNYSGSDSFTYRARDASATSAVATVTITILDNTPLSFRSGVMTPGGFRLQLTGPPASNYVIQASTNLQDWTPISTNVALTGGLVFTDPAATNYSRRFYRAMVQ